MNNLSPIMYLIITFFVIPTISTFIGFLFFVVFKKEKIKIEDSNNENNFKTEVKKNTYKYSEELTLRNEFKIKYNRNLDNTDLFLAKKNTNSSDFNLLISWLILNDDSVNKNFNNTENDVNNCSYNGYNICESNTFLTSNNTND